MQNLCLICVFFLSRDRSQSDQPLHMNMFDFEVVVVVVVFDGTVGFMNGRQGLEYSLRKVSTDFQNFVCYGRFRDNSIFWHQTVLVHGSMPYAKLLP